MSGTLLGEALHRSALQLRRGSGPRWLTVLAASLLDPFAFINGELLGDSTQGEVLEPMFVRWQLGATGGVLMEENERTSRHPVQAVAGVLLVSGAPWNRRSAYDTPLSYFDLRAELELSFPFKVMANLFVRGLLVGARFSSEGVWGLFSSYDFAAAPVVRASGVGLGPGVVFQARLGRAWHLQVGTVVAGSPFASAGQFEVPAGVSRDYHVGVGMQSALDLRLIHPRWLQLELTGRHWLVIGTCVLPEGSEAVAWGTLTATVPIWRWLNVGGEFTVAHRQARFEGADRSDDLALTAKLFMSVISEPGFGVTPRH